MKTTYLLPLFLMYMFLFAHGCGEYTGGYKGGISELKDSPEEYYSGSEEDLSDIDNAPGSAPDTRENIKKIPEKIIKTGSISIETENYNKCLAKMKKLAAQHDAYISDENEYKYSTSITNALTIRVPNNNFEKLAEALIKDEKVNSKTINSEDVTDQYVDLTTRIRTKKAVEQRYRELLAKAGTVEEILKVEEKIGEVREEIEAKEGQLKYLNDRVQYSTLTLTITEYYEDIHEDSFFTKIFNGLKGGWEGLKIFFIVIAWLWPLWLITGAGLWILLRYLKKRKKRKLAKMQGG